MPIPRLAPQLFIGKSELHSCAFLVSTDAIDGKLCLLVEQVVKGSSVRTKNCNLRQYTRKIELKKISVVERALGSYEVTVAMDAHFCPPDAFSHCLIQQ